MSSRNILKRRQKIGAFQGLNIRVLPSVLPTTLLIWAIFSLVGIKVFKWKPVTAVSGGLIATIIHFLSETWHQLGHSKMAEQTGYPMEGIDYWGPLATSVYPSNEGMIAADVHIQRALGGPIFSLLAALISAVIALALRPIGGAALVLAFFTVLDNFLVFTIGALMPLGFTDGSTLLTWWGHRQGNRRFLNID